MPVVMRPGFYYKGERLGIRSCHVNQKVGVGLEVDLGTASEKEE
jgi:hypothetical protein